MAEGGDVLLVGIDEAGYGPVLGPLVVSAVALRAPADRAEECLWKALRKSVSASPQSRRGRLGITDSKKLYQRAEGLAALERAALAALHLADHSPTDLAGLLRAAAGTEMAAQFAAYPWYRDANPALPLAADAGAIRVAAATLRRDAAANDRFPAGVWVEPLPEGHFNRLVDQTRNKAVVSLGLVLRLIQRASDAHPGLPLHVFVDRQGGRAHYRAALMRAFEGCAMQVVEEGDEISRYRMRTPSGEWRIGFFTQGESRHLLVAWASIVSKYLRELFMHCFNEYWRGQEPSLIPTAGYHTDGHRFLRDAEPCIARLGIDRAMLVRSR